jgi:hypothetical protein
MSDKLFYNLHIRINNETSISTLKLEKGKACATLVSVDLDRRQVLSGARVHEKYLMSAERKSGTMNLNHSNNPQESTRR